VLLRLQKKKQNEVLKGRTEEAEQENKTKVPKRAARRKPFTLNEELNAVLCAIFAREDSNMAMSFVVMTVKICITNQAYQDITRIVFHIQKMTLICHTCYKEDNVNNSTDEMLQNIDYDNDISELHVLATQKEICKSVCRSIVL
jgi:hypothetical protein